MPARDHREGRKNSTSANDVVVDAIGGHSHRTEQAALNQLERAGVKFTSAISLLSSFAPDFSKTPGSEVLKEIIVVGAARVAQL
jgi:hypothetical protein